MVLGGVIIILGIVVLIIGLFVDTQNIMQQTIQYLCFVCSSVLVVGGLIIITIKNGLKSLEYSISEIERKLCKPDTSTISNPVPVNKNYGSAWTCKKCSTDNVATDSSCKGCGEYR